MLDFKDYDWDQLGGEFCAPWNGFDYYDDVGDVVPSPAKSNNGLVASTSYSAELAKLHLGKFFFDMLMFPRQKI